MATTEIWHGGKSQLAFKTAYFKTFEDFSNVIDERLGISVITQIWNMPDMTSLQNEERSLLNLVIAVSEIARQYIDDESRLPSGSIALLHQKVNRHIIGNNDKT